MTDFLTLLQGGNAWLFIPSAILLGALHGLEPGHSKTMMAAFIIAVHGTVTQAVMLGLAATVSHTAVVWIIALGGMYFGQRWSAEASEPWMQIISAVMVIGVALWMLWRTARNQAACFHDHGGEGHGHGDHDHDHGHGHGPHARGHDHAHGDAGRGRAHDVHHDHDHAHDEHHGHDHDHAHGAACTHDHASTAASLVVADAQDPHARMHAEQIQARFAGRTVSTSQIILFGLTGGLIPCPASITVLLLCLQLKKIALGATLVLGFSVGLALTMVASGVIAALSLKHLSRRMSGGRFGELAGKAPYLSGALMLVVGLYVGWQGLRGLA